MGAAPLTIVDYDAGNLRSVVRAVEHAGGQPRVTSLPRELSQAGAIILPGVGAAGQAMRRLGELGLDEALVAAAARGVPLLGVCLGLQVLLEHSDEGGPGGTPCLGILQGSVHRFDPGLKVPHMGWNTVSVTGNHANLFTGILDQSYFYFVHSYYAQPLPEVVIGQAEYGITFCAALSAGSVLATQFHPEKSGTAGLRLYANFLKLAGLC